MKRSMSVLLTLCLLIGVIPVFSVLGTASAETSSDYILIDACDDDTGLVSNNNQVTVDETNKKQGLGSLSTYGSSTTYIMHQDSDIAYNIDMPSDWQNWYFECWFYVENLNQIVNGSCIELSQEIDSVELQWEIPNLGLKEGWNKLVLPLTEFQMDDPSVFSKINYLRVFCFLVTDADEITIKIDDVCLSKNITPNNFAALDAAVSRADAYTSEVLANYDEETVNEFTALRESARTHENYTVRDVDVAVENIDNMIAKLEAGKKTVVVSSDVVITQGRTYYDNNGILNFNWTNSGFSFKFNGSTAEAEIKGSGGAIICVYVDDGESPVKTISLTAGINKYTLASGLSSGYHTIKVLKRSENVWGGTAGVKTITVYGNAISSLPKAPVRKIEIIGDSITAGYGNLISDGSISNYRVQDQDGTNTFATLAAKEFGAACSIVAKSGIGFAYNNGGSTTDTMKDAYAYTDYFSLDKTTQWDFSKNINDVVVIALGTNDTCAPSSDAYYQGAKAFLSLVREKNPDSIIIWAYGMMTSSFSDSIQKAVSEAVAAGDDNLYYLSLDIINQTEDGIGAAGHPSMATHIKNGEKLANYISELTGWEKGTFGDEAPSKIKLARDSSLSIDVEGVVSGIKEGKTIADIKAEFADPSYLKFYPSSGSTAAKDTDIIKTGMKVKLLNVSKVIETRVLSVKGDINGDGSVTSSDALLALQHSVKKITLTDAAVLLSANVTDDTEITASDALKILQYSVKKINEL